MIHKESGIVFENRKQVRQLLKYYRLKEAYENGEFEFIPKEEEYKYQLSGKIVPDSEEE